MERWIDLGRRTLYYVKEEPEVLKVELSFLQNALNVSENAPLLWMNADRVFTLIKEKRAEAFNTQYRFLYDVYYQITLNPDVEQFLAKLGLDQGMRLAHRAHELDNRWEAFKADQADYLADIEAIREALGKNVPPPMSRDELMRRKDEASERVDAARPGIAKRMRKRIDRCQRALDAHKNDPDWYGMYRRDLMALLWVLDFDRQEAVKDQKVETSVEA